MKPDVQTAAQVHFMVGDAYSTIVAISGGLLGRMADTVRHLKKVRRRASWACNTTARVAVDHASQNAKDAWGQAWLLPVSLFLGSKHVCYGD